MIGELVCPICGHREPLSLQPVRCPRCGVPLRYQAPLPESLEPLSGRGVWRYRALLPDVEPVSLGEGGTPLVPSRKLGRELGIELSFKLEGTNPTGSFKDRGASVLVSVLKALGAKTVADDSSGNAAAALAAYAARAGLRARLFVPAYASEKKLQQVEAYGATLERVPGVRAQATLALRAALERDPELVYASHNESPYFELGQRTIAYEIAEELGWRAPDHVVAPVGGGALFLGIVNGFSRLVELGLIGELPRVHAVQAAACAPIVAAWRAGLAEPQPVEAGRSLAEGVLITAPPRGREIIAALRRASGSAVAVTEDEIAASWRSLPREEGLYVEPTSAVAVAGLAKLIGEGAIRPGEMVVVPLTGMGLKHSPE